MNEKQAKKIRKIINQKTPDVVQMFNGLKRWPFRMRLRLAWQLLKGVSRPRLQRSGTGNTAKDAK